MKTIKKIRVGIVVPHIFIMRGILENVIFSPGTLAIDLCEELEENGADVTLYAPGPVDTSVHTVTADLSYFENELAGRGDTYLELLKKHPFTFISLARQVQSEIIARAYRDAADDKLDIVHIYTNEEDIALPFAKLCAKPVIFTHHDPFNFLVKYKSVFPKYKDLNWISLSMAQRTGMPERTNWVANIYHGLSKSSLQPVASPTNDYVAFLGRIIEPKGVHLAIDAVERYSHETGNRLKLKIAGRHYAEHEKDTYWREQIEPRLNKHIEYVGPIKKRTDKQAFLANAQALIVPSTFDEPFGMVTIEALACGTPVIGLPHGATPEIIEDGKTGFITESDSIHTALKNIESIDRTACRQIFEQRFTTTRMARDHIAAYKKVLN